MAHGRAGAQARSIAAPAEAPVGLLDGDAGLVVGPHAALEFPQWSRKGGQRRESEPTIVYG